MVINLLVRIAAKALSTIDNRHKTVAETAPRFYLRCSSIGHILGGCGPYTNITCFITQLYVLVEHEDAIFNGVTVRRISWHSFLFRIVVLIVSAELKDHVLDGVAPGQSFIFLLHCSREDLFWTVWTTVLAIVLLV